MWGFQRSVEVTREENRLRTSGFYVPVPLLRFFVLLFMASIDLNVQARFHRCITIVAFVPTFKLYLYLERSVVCRPVSIITVVVFSVLLSVL